MTDIHSDKILILDFGAQYTQLIARRIRELGVYCEIWAWDHDPAEIEAYGAKGIILSGGPESTTLPGAPRAPQQVFDAGLPILGICYGMQTMAAQLGGATEAADQREFGHAEVQLVAQDRLFDGLKDHPGSPPRLDVWMSHGDHVSKAPDGFVVTAKTDRIPVAAFADDARRWYGVQFHPEVTHTKQGQTLLRRFVVDICGCQTLWTAAHIIDDQIARVRELVGDDEVILGLSGGVDSSVAAALIHRAIGDQLTCVFVDHGLLRQNEGQLVMDMFVGRLHAKVIHIDASDQFLGHLTGVSDPEKKRKIIGREFVEVFQSEAKKLSNAKWLAQGTIYPDVVESGGTASKKATIKSHHNVGGLPETLGLKLLEPLRELFKDEVRELGVALGLPPEMVYRHPFPGPGLGVRILGEVKREYADLLRRADAIFIEELRNTRDEASGKTWYELTSQAFVVFLPVKSVGVMGDGRTYDYVVALRAVQTSDFMTADWAELPYSLLKKVSGRIINEVRGINRVAYDVSSKPPATIEWE